MLKVPYELMQICEGLRGQAIKTLADEHNHKVNSIDQFCSSSLLMQFCHFWLRVVPSVWSWAVRLIQEAHQHQFRDGPDALGACQSGLCQFEYF